MRKKRENATRELRGLALLSALTEPTVASTPTPPKTDEEHAEDKLFELAMSVVDLSQKVGRSADIRAAVDHFLPNHDVEGIPGFDLGTWIGHEWAIRRFRVRDELAAIGLGQFETALRDSIVGSSLTRLQLVELLVSWHTWELFDAFVPTKDGGEVTKMIVRSYLSKTAGQDKGRSHLATARALHMAQIEDAVLAESTRYKPTNAALKLIISRCLENPPLGVARTSALKSESKQLARIRTWMESKDSAKDCPSGRNIAYRFGRSDPFGIQTE